jgi:hypothetical protein
MLTQFLLVSAMWSNGDTSASNMPLVPPMMYPYMYPPYVPPYMYPGAGGNMSSMPNVPMGNGDMPK